MKHGFAFFFLILSAPLMPAAAPPTKPTTAGRPNILLFLADDWGRNASCYRDPVRLSVNDVIETPNIDRVAREGVLFRNAFMGVSSCAPSRASMVTGSYFWRCGRKAFLNTKAEGWRGIHDPGADLAGFGQLLQEAGWATSHRGKTFTEDWFPGTGFTEGGRLALKTYTKNGKLGYPEALQALEKNLRSTIQKVLKTRNPGQPFCHVVGPIDPHRPFVKGSGQSWWGIDPGALQGKLPPYLPDVPEFREDFADTLGEVLSLDRQVGWILDELDKAGELDNTLLVLTGDNGINMPRGKAHCYDLSLHAPLMIRWPAGIAKPGRVVDDFVSHIDLAPTWLEAAGIQPPTTMDGRSLLPLLKSEKSGVIDPTRDAVIAGRERHEFNVRPDFSPYPMRALRTADFLYIRNFKPDRWPSGDPYSDPVALGDPNPQGSPGIEWFVNHRNDPAVKPLYDLAYGKRPAEELYDLRQDPDQMRNVAPDPAYAETRQKLASRLMAVLESTHDPRLTDAFDKPPYVTESAANPGRKKKSKEDDRSE